MEYHQPLLQQWNLKQLKRCTQKTKQATLSDERSLVFYAEDFGHMLHEPPKAVFIPNTPKDIQHIVEFSNTERLPLTLRGKGLSQGGQSLSGKGGLTLSLEKFTKVLEEDNEGIWVEANATWSLLLEQSLKTCRIPRVTPYNCDLSIAGVLSAGGIGAQSFKEGAIVDQVLGLEVITADGVIHQLEPKDTLFQACLGGQGRFGIITKAKIALRACKPKIKTFFLLYLEKDAWLQDLKKYICAADYLECFASPAIQGAKLTNTARVPFAQWFYVLQVSVEYEIKVPELKDLVAGAQPWKVMHSQEECINSFLHRHDGRFQFMKATGLWDLQHLWYECFVREATLIPHLEEILNTLPLYYAQVVQIVPIKNRSNSNFLILPEDPLIFAFMILNPGLVQALIPGVCSTIQALDSQFLGQGGKRYLSGFLGTKLKTAYWEQHFGSRNKDWYSIKKYYDPNGIFCSLLHPI